MTTEIIFNELYHWKAYENLTQIKVAYGSYDMGYKIRRELFMIYPSYYNSIFREQTSRGTQGAMTEVEFHDAWCGDFFELQE